MIADATAALGYVDILVNNAGLTRDGLAMRMKDEDWTAVIDVNLTGTFRLIRAAMKGMMKRRAGRIINMASVVGVTGNAGQANYAASKGGMIAMSKALAGELAPRGVTVNCVAPGFIETAMTADLPEKAKEAMLATIPTGRMGQPEEIAAAVAFLASDEASYLTGTVLNVNGAHSVHHYIKAKQDSTCFNLSVFNSKRRSLQQGWPKCGPPNPFVRPAEP